MDYTVWLIRIFAIQLYILCGFFISKLFFKIKFKNHLKYFQRGVLFMSGIISVMTQSLILSIMALGFI